MAKTREFKVKINGRTYRPSIASANQPIVIVGDGPGGFDTPRIAFTMVRDDAPEGSEIQVRIRFQRHLVPSDFASSDRPARGWMDTRRPWSECYAGKVETDVELEVGRKFNIGTGARVLEAISVAIGREIDERNLRHVTTCELDQTVRALEYLGVRLDRKYDNGREVVYLHDMGEGRYANARAEQAEQKRQRDEAERKRAALADEQADAGVAAARDEVRS